MPNVTLYQLPTVVQLTENNAVSVGTVINRTDFNLHKGVANDVEFLLKTIDRKPVNLTSRNFVLYLIDHATGQLMIQADLVVINPLLGHCRMTLSETDVAGLQLGYFRYVVTELKTSGQTPVYTDQNHSLRGWAELFEGPLPASPAPLNILGSAFQISSWGNPIQAYMLAEQYPGAAQRGNSTGKHTLALYSQNFRGTFWVQASISNDIPSVSDWFDVSETVITTDDTVTGISFTGNYLWVRFFYQPGPMNTGSITKAVFKN